MTVEELIELGNRCRDENRPSDALLCYAQAFTHDPDSFSAWNNYGNVLRECARPDRAIPFLETAIKIIEQSLAKGWKGLFKLKENETGINANSKQSIAERQASKLREYSTTEF